MLNKASGGRGRSGIIPIYQDDAEKCGHKCRIDPQGRFSGAPAPCATCGGHGTITLSRMTPPKRGAAQPCHCAGLSRVTRLAGAVMVAAMVAGCEDHREMTPRSCVEAGRESVFVADKMAFECRPARSGGRSNG